MGIKLLVSLAILLVARAIPSLTRSSWAGSLLLAFTTACCVADWAVRHDQGTADLGVAVFFLLAWPAIEAGYHRWIMHSRRPSLVQHNHAVHHANPTVINGLIPVYHVLQLQAGYWVFIERHYISTGLVCVMLLLCAYEVVHALIHAGHAPKFLERHHMRHHKYPRENFNVTSTLY